MAVCLGKNQRLGHFFSARKQCREQIFLKCTDHGSYLAWVDDVPVKLSGNVMYILVQLFPSLGSGQTVPVFDQLLHQMRTIFGDLCFNEEDIFPHIHTVNNSLLPGIFTHDIFVEKSKGAVIRGGGQADNKSVKVG